MTIDELKEKVRLAEEKCAKIEKTIERHKTQGEKKVMALNKIMEQNNLGITYDDVCDNPNWYYDYQNQPFYHELYWTACDIRDKESSINDNLKKLKAAQEGVKIWQEKLRLEEVKLQYIQDSVPRVIKEFLNEWKSRVIEYYTKKAEEYPEALQEYQETRDKLYYECLVEIVNRLVEENKEEFIQKYCWKSEDRFNRIIDTLNEGFKPNNNYEYINLIHFGYRDKNDPDEHPKYVRNEEQWKAKFGDGFFQAWLSRKFDPDWLDKQIEQEKNNKLIDLMTRVSKITGEIIDAQYLYIADDGNLNGYIIGKDGKAEVETIGAGGYNEHVILDSGRHGQCYHFRVLVKPKK